MTLRVHQCNDAENTTLIEQRRAKQPTSNSSENQSINQSINQSVNRSNEMNIIG